MWILQKVLNVECGVWNEGKAKMDENAPSAQENG